jgi:hypothetical protein
MKRTIIALVIFIGFGWFNHFYTFYHHYFYPPQIKVSENGDMTCKKGYIKPLSVQKKIRYKK